MKRIFSLGAVLLISVVAAVAASTVRFDMSMDVWFLEDDPDLVAYHHFLATFASDQVVVLAWEDPELWTDQGLAFVHEVTQRSEALRLAHPGGSTLPSFGVQSARSITSIDEVLALPGSLSISPLYDPEQPPDPAVLRDRVMGDDQLRRRFVSEDGQVCAVVLVVDHLTDESHLKIPLSAALREMVAELESYRNVKIAVAGSTLLDDAFFRYTERDLMTIFPAMVFVILLAILVLFRSPRALPLPMAVVLLTCLWVTGVMGLAGKGMTVIHSAIYPMLLGVGIACSIHVMTRALLLRREGRKPREAAHQALSQMLAPCFYTAATTIAGLLSLCSADLSPVRQMGVLGAVGVAFSFVLTFALGPWLLPMLPAPSGPEETRSGALSRWWARWDRGLVALAAWVQRRSWMVVLGSAALLVLALSGLRYLEVGSNPMNYFQADNPARQDLLFVDEHLAGTISIEVLVDTGSVGGLKEPAVLKAMVRTQDFLEGLEGVGATASLADYVVALRQAMHGGGETERRIPVTRAEVSQLLLLLDDPQELERFADFDFQKGRVHATVRMSEGEELAARSAQVDRFLMEQFPAPASASATGLSRLISNMETYLLQSQIRSLSLAFVTVLFFMVLALRSIRLGLFSMIPNLLPIGMALGFMGWVGIPLDPGTAMTGAVALGLVVDDTVHFLYHFKERSLAGDPLETATRATLMDTGRAITMTSVILVAGFWLLTLASFLPNIYFGLLCGVAILLALLANLVVLPAVLAIVRPKLVSR